MTGEQIKDKPLSIGRNNITLNPSDVKQHARMSRAPALPFARHRPIAANTAERES